MKSRWARPFLSYECLNSGRWLFKLPLVSDQSKSRATSHWPANLSQQVLLKHQKRKHKIKSAIPAVFIYWEPVLITIDYSLVSSW